MTDEQPDDRVEFDELVMRALAESALGPVPRPDLKALLLAGVSETPITPAGFRFELAADDTWLPFSIPGIRMKILAISKRKGYATVLLDVPPGVRFPAHHHSGDEECLVLSGSVHTLGLRLGPGDFLHADADTYHPELWTEEGARVLLVVPAEEVLSS